jgi:hypothetical protein
LLDRARLSVVPLGVEAMARSLTGHGPATNADSLEVARQVLQQLHDHLQAAGRAAHLEMVLDSPGPGLTEMLPAANLSSAGMSCADGSATPEQQVTAAGMVHAISRHGTARILWPNRARATPDDLVELLHFAWRRTEVVRVMLAPNITAHEPCELSL